MKKTVTHFVLPVLAIIGIASGISVAQRPKSNVQLATLEKLIVESGTVAFNLDLNRLNGLSNGADSVATPLTFQAAPNSFFQVLVYNNELRGPTTGSIVLVPGSAALLPAALNASINQLVVEKMSDDVHDLVIRDGKTGFIFFNLEALRYEYNATTHALQMNSARLAVSDEFAKTMGRPGDAGAAVGSVSISAMMRAIEVRNVVNGEEQSAVLPPTRLTDAPSAFVPGPDVIVGDIPSMDQAGSAGGFVGLEVGTTSCNAGNVELDWFAMPNVDHPVIPQNFYRMSASGDRMEQIGQSWLKHAFTALQNNACSFGCTSAANGTHLGVGCSDPYSAGLNGSQSGLGSRAWVNPFTGAYPSTARDHTGHTETGTSHRVLVDVNDLNTTLNSGAAYFAEAQYVTPHEYAWCQSHAGECNMYNNASYRRFNVSGTTSFSFTANGSTVRATPAIAAWTGATMNTIEPAPGVDGRGIVAYKVTGPANGLYHYEYAINNQNLDRAIQSFSVPLGCATTLSNIGFHAPLNSPGAAQDGTTGNAGFSNAPWTNSQTATAISWSSETLAQNPNANAIRWGTTYNFRFDTDRPPQAATATVGFYKTGAPITVSIQAPSPGCSPLQAVSAVSRKTQGGAGTFDIPLPLTGERGVECRRSADGNHTIVVTFSNNVVSGSATVSEGSGSVVGTPTFSGSTMTVVVSGMSNAQAATVMLSGVTDNFSQTLPDTAVPMKVLWGDINASGSVTASDIGQVKAEASNPVTATNFRADVTADGAVSSSDIGAVKSMAGATVP